MRRFGFDEESYFTFSYSAIRAESGGVGGVQVTCIETTDRVLGERRMKTLRALSEQAGEARTVSVACDVAMQTIAAAPADVPFAALYLVDATTRELRLLRATPDAAASSFLVTIAQHTPSKWPLAQVAASGQSAIVDDVIERFGVLPGGPWPDPPRTAVIVPVAQPGQAAPAAVLVLGVSSAKRLDEAYRGFLARLAQGLAATIANARAYEEERKRAEALAELDRAKTAFFSNVSHEFRTPLTLMLGPLEEALSSADVPEALRDDITIAHRNALRLLKLVNMLFDFSRIESSRVRAMYEPVELASFTVELASNFRSAVERAGLRLDVDCPALPEPVWIDRDMWEKVVLNLLSNAFKFTLSGTITVRTSMTDDRRAKLVIQDTGTGIAAEDLPHIFERFHRIRGVRARSHEGSGIGLALVQELVKLHGGSIAVESMPGQGTTFTIHIPMGTEHLPKDQIATPHDLPSTSIGARPFVEEALRWLPDPGTAAADPGHAKPRVLVADDNADMRAYVTRLLMRDYDVAAVGDGDSALSDARAHPPDVVLADIMMPGMDGMELLRALRADPRTSNIPIVLLSARAGDEAKVAGLDAGADDYLVKPFSARELHARVRTHVTLAQERRRVADELGMHVASLERANAEVRDARRATLNVLEDAVEARSRAEQLYGEAEEYAGWMTGQRKSLETAVDGAPLPVSLGVLVDVATSALGTGTRAAFYLAGPDGLSLHHVLGMTPEYAAAVDGFQIGPESLACGLATHTGQPVVTVDVHDDPRWEPWRWLADRFGYRGCWSFPVNTSAGKFVGTLALYSVRPRSPTKRNLELASLLTNTASIIISRHHESEVRKQAERALHDNERRSLLLRDAVHPDDRERAEQQWRDAVTSARALDTDVRLRAIDGSYRLTAIRAVPQRNDHGETDKWLGIGLPAEEPRH